MLARFIELGRILTRRQRSRPRPDDIRGASESWLATIPPVRRAKRPREPMRPFLPAPRRRRRRVPVVNVGPGKLRLRRYASAMPQHPTDRRAKAVRAAWKARDWWALKAFGEIDTIPEL